MLDDPRALNILMAEDDPDDRTLLQEAFAEAGMPGRLDFVENGHELLDALAVAESGAAESPPNLILLDLNMPRMGGHAALARIKQDPALRKIPVIVLSTSDAEEDIARAYDLGVNSYITKPASFAALVSAVNTLKDYWIGTVTLPDPT